MKLYKSYILSLMAILLWGCKGSEDFCDVAYVTGTMSSPVIKFNLDGPSSIGITVSTTTKVENDMNFKLQVRPELLSSYNQANGRSFEIPPSEAFELTNQEVVINSGGHISSQAKLTISDPSLLKDGVSYCIPVSIVSSEGELDVMESGRTAFVAISKVITSKVASLQGSNYFTVSSFTSTNKDQVSSLRQLTMECKVLVSRFQTNSPFISTLMGIEENFLLRFGDVSCDNDQLQLAAGTVGGVKYPITLESHFATNRWYHIAVVYDGINVTIYVDGKEQGTTMTTGGVVDLSYSYNGQGFCIGYSVNGNRNFRGYISEARIWRVARTPEQLEDGVCYVDPTSEGLVAYWRFNGEEDDNNTVQDLTGHGNQAKASGNITYVDNQKCPF